MLCNLTEGGQVREFIQLLPPTTVLPAAHYIPPTPLSPYNIPKQMTLCFPLHTLTTPPCSLSGLYDFFLVSPNSITNTPPPPTHTSPMTTQESCYPYWPTSVDATAHYGKLLVTLKSEKEDGDFIIRKFDITEEKVSCSYECVCVFV